MTAQPRVERIRAYPVKSLDGIDVDVAKLVEGGTIKFDREYAMFDADDEYVNGKRTDAVHRIDSVFDPETRDLTLREQGQSERQAETFALDLESEREAANDWLSDYFGERIELRRADQGGYPDIEDALGPSIVSTATLRELASWFPGISVESMRRRIRANVEIGGVPAFWEDRLFANEGEAVEFELGGNRLLGVRPVPRCIVPARDPDTGEEYESFQETFVERRKETLPEWTPSDRFDHNYYAMVITHTPRGSLGGEIEIGDPASPARELTVHEI